MIKALSLAAALAVLPLSAAAAQEPETTEAAATSAEAAIEAAAGRFELRMEEFGERAEALSADESLPEEQREARVAALWGEYAPDVQAFTAVVTEHAATIAGHGRQRLVGVQRSRAHGHLRPDGRLRHRRGDGRGR